MEFETDDMNYLFYAIDYKIQERTAFAISLICTENFEECMKQIVIEETMKKKKKEHEEKLRKLQYEILFEKVPPKKKIQKKKKKINLNKMNILDFPDELVIILSRYLDTNSIFILALTCKKFANFFRVFSFRDIATLGVKAIKENRKKRIFRELLVEKTIEIQTLHEEVSKLQDSCLKRIDKQKSLTQELNLVYKELEEAKTLNSWYHEIFLRIDQLTEFVTGNECGWIFHTAKMCATTHQNFPVETYNEFWQTGSFQKSKDQIEEFKKGLDEHNFTKKILPLLKKQKRN